LGVRWIGESEALQYVSARTLRRWAKERGLRTTRQRVGRDTVMLIDGDEFYHLLDTIIPGKKLT
jgi:hypothetical protein